MSASAPERLSVAELGRALAERQWSSVELTKHLLARITAQHELGCFLHVDEATALEAAAAADARRAAGDTTTLLGVPVAHKDIFVTRDAPTTAGSKMLAGYRSPFDATVVARLREAGMVSLGKLNCDEFAMGSANENSAYAPVRNPWDRSRVPGGSSGGSAAAVAARLVPAATGTDTGGSIRQPAAITGTVGIKPTYGRCSRYGIVAFASSLDQAGPIAKTVRDAAILLRHMASVDAKDSTSVEVPVPDYEAAVGRSIKGLKVGVPKEYRIDGMPRAESDALLDEVFAWCDRPEFQWRHHWRMGDTIIWENRSAVHSASMDYPLDQRRIFMRATVRGTNTLTEAMVADLVA